ncbi:hypothetical protein PMZ80_009018 [Knufia obscura]|uniref:Uncharacterized protein n=1 Tax=Knufia obscura TaxID=1635080 RepID=A0ABR0RDW8_9EURO|nr:hypothetical protein PMZ80_009018 [Knufia obscura]
MSSTFLAERQTRYLHVHLQLLRLQMIVGYFLESHSITVRMHLLRTWVSRVQYLIDDVVARDPLMTDQERFIYHTLAAEFYLAAWTNRRILPATNTAKREKRCLREKIRSRLGKTRRASTTDKQCEEAKFLLQAEYHLYYAALLEQQPRVLGLLHHVQVLLERKKLGRVMKVLRTWDSSGHHQWIGEAKMADRWRSAQHSGWQMIGSNADGFRHSWPKQTTRETKDVKQLKKAFASRTDVLKIMNRMLAPVAMPTSVEDASRLYGELMRYYVRDLTSEPPTRTAQATSSSDFLDHTNAPDMLEYYYLGSSWSTRLAKLKMVAGSSTSGDQREYEFWQGVLITYS